MSRKIILFGPLPPPYGGVAIYMQALVAHLHTANVRVWTYGGARPEPSEARFIEHRRLGTFQALLAEARQARILDASHFHLEYPNPLLLPIWLGLKRWLGFEWYKNILDGSLPTRYPHFSARQRRLFQRAVGSVDQFVVASEELKRWLQTEIKASQPITVIHCLLPGPAQSEVEFSKTTLRLLEPYLEREKRVCCIGVFVASYGFKQVAEAVEKLRQESKRDIGLVLIDGGFVRDEEYRSETLRGRDWITVLEEVPNPELQQVLKRSDVFVRGVADEGYGISRIEAIWCGLQVVATRTGETRGMLLYDFGNEEELISQLNVALFNPPARENEKWAEYYRLDAQKNLQDLKVALGIA